MATNTRSGYSFRSLEKFVYDSIVPGICSKCKKKTRVEPDAEKYNCTKCGGVGTVNSVLIIEGLI